MKQRAMLEELASLYFLISVDFLDEKGNTTKSDPKTARLLFSNGQEVDVDFDQFASLNDIKFRTGSLRMH